VAQTAIMEGGLHFFFFFFVNMREDSIEPHQVLAIFPPEMPHQKTIDVIAQGTRSLALSMDDDKMT